MPVIQVTSREAFCHAVRVPALRIPPISSMVPVQIACPEITILEFYTKYCPACVTMNPVFDRAEASPDFSTLRFYKINCNGSDETQNLSSHIRGVSYCLF